MKLTSINVLIICPVCVYRFILPILICNVSRNNPSTKPWTWTSGLLFFDSVMRYVNVNYKTLIVLNIRRALVLTFLFFLLLIFLKECSVLIKQSALANPIGRLHLSTRSGPFLVWYLSSVLITSNVCRLSLTSATTMKVKRGRYSWIITWSGPGSACSLCHDLCFKLELKNRHRFKLEDRAVHVWEPDGKMSASDCFS